ncbi:MAG: recombinase family protein [Candidatus Competibacteraceae bacterium]|nr:recombinase family protein [Candidatus Competibacteraceae bacterium]
MGSVVGYVRVSTLMQVEEGQSLEAQRAKIEAWAGLNDYDLKAIHRDAGISGKKIKNRPGLQAALQACGPGDVLVVYSLSRLSRSIRDTLDISDHLDKTGADWVSLSEKIDTTSAAGKMVFRMLSVMAQFESDQISERVTWGMQHKKAQGVRVGTVPFGYRLAADGATLIPDDTEQHIIAVIREQRSLGLSLRAIVARLHERGYQSRAGKPLQLTQIMRIVNG